MKRSFIIALAIFACSTLAVGKVGILADNYEWAKQYSYSHDINKLVNILENDTIYFSDFDPEKDITSFKNIEPDTIWIKDRPKKNPKEGKHYILAHLYRSDIEIDGKFVYEFTPASNITNSLFRVDKVEANKPSTYYGHKEYTVYLTNLTTDRKLKWQFGEKSFDRDGCIVHLVGKNKSVNLAGKNVYTAIKGSYGDTDYTSFKKYRCLKTDCVLDLTSATPVFEIRLTKTDDNNNETTAPIPLGKPILNSDPVMLSEDQYRQIEDANRTYEIDYNVNLNRNYDTVPMGIPCIVGQTDGYYSVKAYQTLKPGRSTLYRDGVSIDVGLDVLIADRINVRGVDYYIAVCQGKPFYIETKDVVLYDEHKPLLEKIVSATEEERKEYFEYTKALSLYTYVSECKEVLDRIESFGAKGVSIIDMHAYDESEYTDGTGLFIKFYNPTKKTIKYVNITLVGYNAVDDRVGSSITHKCIGPIEPDDAAEYVFEYEWFTDVVEYAMLTSMSVQYMDGTVKKVANPSSVIWTEDMLEVLKPDKLGDLKVNIIEQ